MNKTPTELTTFVCGLAESPMVVSVIVAQYIARKYFLLMKIKE